MEGGEVVIFVVGWRGWRGETAAPRAIARGGGGTHGQESNGVDGQLIEVGIGHDGGLWERWMRRWTLGRGG